MAMCRWPAGQSLVFRMPAAWRLTAASPTAEVVVVEAVGRGMGGLFWLRAEAGEVPQRDRPGELDWLPRYGGRACAMSGGGDGGSGTER